MNIFQGVLASLQFFYKKIPDIYTVRCPKWAICALSGPPSFLNLFLYIYAMKIFCDFFIKPYLCSYLLNLVFCQSTQYQSFCFFYKLFFKNLNKNSQGKNPQKTNTVKFYKVVVLTIVSSPCNWEKNLTNIDGVINHYTAGALTPSFLEWY